MLNNFNKKLRARALLLFLTGNNLRFVNLYKMLKKNLKLSQLILIKAYKKDGNRLEYRR